MGCSSINGTWVQALSRQMMKVYGKPYAILRITETRARENIFAGGGSQKSEDVKSGLATLPNPISPVDTCKELADTVGLGERMMGKVIQIVEGRSDQRVLKAMVAVCRSSLINLRRNGIVKESI